MQQLTPTQLKRHLDTAHPAPLLLDIREPKEFAYCHIDGSLHIPMGQIASRIAELDPNRETVVICHHGIRSFQAAQFLEGRGFERVINLSGGIDAWARDVDRAMPSY